MPKKKSRLEENVKFEQQYCIPACNYAEFAQAPACRTANPLRCKYDNKIHDRWSPCPYHKSST